MQTTPKIKATALSIQGLKALDSVDWPQVGGGQLPDLMVISGPNGSGKTTLLEFIANAASCMASRMWPGELCPLRDSWVEFRVAGEPGGMETVRFVIGSNEFLQLHKTRPSYGVIAEPGRARHNIVDQSDWVRDVRRSFPTKNESIALPSVVYFPSQRAFEIPSTAYRYAGKPDVARPFFHHWSAPKAWRDSLEAQLYAARWEDLNAREEGRPEDAVHFERYVSAFERVTQGRKTLVWRGGELFVLLREQELFHSLGELSSGEKQMLIFSAELRRWWYPGSLILIDEPELHMHTHWQELLVGLLKDWQAELGGQVIMSTLSQTIFEAFPEGSRFHLNG